MNHRLHRRDDPRTASYRLTTRTPGKSHYPQLYFPLHHLPRHYLLPNYLPFSKDPTHPLVRPEVPVDLLHELQRPARLHPRGPDLTLMTIREQVTILDIMGHDVPDLLLCLAHTAEHPPTIMHTELPFSVFWQTRLLRTLTSSRKNLEEPRLSCGRTPAWSPTFTRPTLTSRLIHYCLFDRCCYINRSAPDHR